MSCCHIVWIPSHALTRLDTEIYAPCVSWHAGTRSDTVPLCTFIFLSCPKIFSRHHDQCILLVTLVLNPRQRVEKRAKSTQPSTIERIVLQYGSAPPYQCHNIWSIVMSINFFWATFSNHWGIILLKGNPALYHHHWYCWSTNQLSISQRTSTSYPKLVG